MQRRRRHPVSVAVSYHEAATIILNHPEVVGGRSYCYRPSCPCHFCSQGFPEGIVIKLETQSDLFDSEALLISREAGALLISQLEASRATRCGQDPS